MMKLHAIEKRMLLFILFIGLLLSLRILYSGSLVYSFLLWNLFLAYVPLRLSLLLEKAPSIFSWLLLALWLLFFPNALYLVTDLIHLKQRPRIPLWYDALLLFATASAGLIFGFASLYRVELFLKSKITPGWCTLFLHVFLLLGAFGVYAGRFLRWNSWDILCHPFRISIAVIGRILMPFQYAHAWAAICLFACLFSLLYFSIRRLPEYLQKK